MKKHVVALTAAAVALAGVFSATAFSSWEQCKVDCLERYQVCMDSGANERDCDRLYRQCSQHCGTAQ